MHRYLISVCFFSPTTYYATDNVLGKHSDHFSKFIFKFFFWSQFVSRTQATCKWCPLPALSSVKLHSVSAEVFKTFPIQYGWMNKKADCNGISYGWGFVYSFPRNCTLIICVLVRTFFCDYMQYLLFITTSHICILLSVYVSPCNIVPS